MKVPLEIENQIEQQKIAAYVVNHLPIIKAYADRIGLVPTINRLVDSEMDIDPGTVFLGMVLDTLSGRSPLYRLDEFFESQDTELLLGKKVDTCRFSDHNVTRVMDKAHGVGTIKIFSALAANAVDAFGVDTRPTKKRPAAHYKAYETQVVIKNKPYRAVVIHSSAHDKRRQKRIERQLATERKVLERHCKDVSKKLFYCEADASAAARALTELSLKYYQVAVEIEQRPLYQRGRPKGGVKRISQMRYGLHCKISENKPAVSKLQKEAGCFVLITNVPADGDSSYDSRAILRAYKDQYGIEQNFGFLKDPMIVNSVFLKKPKRIEVLGLVLLISLLIWRLIERSMRQFVATDEKDLPGWKKRRTTQPTTFMLMTKFQGVMILKIGSDRRLNKPLKPQQLEYLSALKVSPEAFTSPRAG